MINDLKNDIANFLKRENIYVSNILVDWTIVYLIFLKHLCEINKYKYEDVIVSDELYGDSRINSIINIYIKDNYFAINSLLRNYTSITSKELLLEFIKNHKDNSNFYNVNGKKITYIFGSGFDDDRYGLSLYDISGQTTYVYDKFKNIFLEIYIIFDEILKINNDYQDIKDINLDDFENVCVVDTSSKIATKDQDMYKFIFRAIIKGKNVIFYSKYNKIGSFKNGYSLASYINIILIKDKDVIMFFKKDVKEISIINCNNLKDCSKEKIDEIIEKNRKQKDVLVKISYDDLIKNKMRIGFNLYQMDKDNKDININEIVDENTRYLRRLNKLNEEVERETNKLFNL